MTKKIYGYMRVSTAEQNEDRQRLDLLGWGVPPANLYMDKLSGKDFNRPQYQRLKRRLRAGDLLVLKSIDRLGRNYADIQEEWRVITKVIGADMVILDMPLLDTRKDKDLIGTLIADIVLQLLSYVAETERVNIRQRQAEGIAAARLRGVHLGRRARALPQEFFSVYELWRDKKITRRQAAARLGVTINQFDWMKKRAARGLTQGQEQGKT